MQISLYEPAPVASALMVAEEGGCFRPADSRDILRAAEIILLEQVRDTPSLTDPSAVKQYLRVKLGELEHEVFLVLYLNSQHKVIDVEEAFRGTLSQTSVYPREIVKRCLHHNAGAVIFAHNHPSGEATPSRADEHLTQQLKTALALIDVRVLDHLVVTATQATSMAERGLI